MAVPRHRRRLVHFVPGEVCVVVAGSAATDAPGPAYEKIRRELNDRIAEYLVGRRSSRSGAFESDLTPHTLLKYKGTLAARPILQPLELPQPGPGPDSLTPWVVLGSARGVRRPAAPPTTLCFYALGMPEDAVVREVVNLVNGHMLGPLGGEQELRIVAATPNWLAAGSQSDFTGGGPGARPEPAPRGSTWQFQFSNRQLQALTESPPDERLIVAVLDTCPEPRAVAAAVDEWGQTNALLADVAANVSLGDAPSLPGDYFERRVSHRVVNWDTLLDQPRPDEHFLMPDHGLFVAGIIRDIAPHADIRLIRVLGDYGVGDLYGLVTVLGRLAGLVRGTPRRKLIVNMSLVVDVPPSDKLLELWYPRSSADLSIVRQRWTDICASMGLLHRSLAEVIGWLQQQGVLIVAAAGNDNLQRQRSNGSTMSATRPEPRVPARYDSVLGVGAVRSNRTSAAYSNRGDVVVIGNGVAIFGGNADRDPIDPARPPVINTAGRPVDAVVGIYSAPDFPLSDPPRNTNVSGWAYWAGTSFAAPVVTAIAANYWPSSGPAGPDQVIDEMIRLFSDPTVSTDLDCPTIVAQQRRVPAP